MLLPVAGTALLIIAGLLLFRRYTVISVHEKHKLMLEHLEREKLEELNQMKLRFFTNISHEFRTPLCLTVGPIDNLLKEQQNGDIKMRNQLVMARRNARVLLRV